MDERLEETFRVLIAEYSKALKWTRGKLKEKGRIRKILFVR